MGLDRVAITSKGWLLIKSSRQKKQTKEETDIALKTVLWHSKDHEFEVLIGQEQRELSE